MKSIRTIVAMAAAFVLFGCASIVSDSNYLVNIDSDPTAKFTITDRDGFEVYSGTTPDVVELPSGDGFFTAARYIVEFKSGGETVKRLPIRATVDGWIFGNILLGGLPGLVIDGATGAMYALPGRVYTSLGDGTADAGFQIIDIATLSADEVESLIAL